MTNDERVKGYNKFVIFSSCHCLNVLLCDNVLSLLVMKFNVSALKRIKVSFFI